MVGNQWVKDGKRKGRRKEGKYLFEWFKAVEERGIEKRE